MTAYVDSSALLKNYIDEADAAAAQRLLSSDPVLVTSWVTMIEVRRNLARLLSGPDLRHAKQQFTDDLDSIALVVVDETVCRSAADRRATRGQIARRGTPCKRTPTGDSRPVVHHL